MKIFKDKIFTIPLWLLVVLSVVSFGSLILIFVYKLEEQFYAYIDFVLSAYTLTALCFYCANTLPNVIKKVKQKAYSVYFHYDKTCRSVSVYVVA